MNVQYAIFCEDIHNDPNGKTSLIGIFDDIFIQGTIRGGKPSKRVPPVPHKCKLVAKILGLSKGNHKLYVTYRKPSGEGMAITKPQVFYFAGGISHRIEIDLSFAITESGIYYFPLLIDDEPIIELALPIKLEVKYI